MGSNRLASGTVGSHTEKPNRLASEKSPYLRQHASNPVAWYPWGAEAFEKARRENKPIFLSIGYSACHWCHVMERESFSNPGVAAFLNSHYVPVLVDREERPDIDRLYMTFVQASTGGGGWPLSIWLTPPLKPFFGGTYFAPEGARGRPGFLAVLSQISGMWKDQHDRILQSSDQMLAALAADSLSAAPTGSPPVAALRNRALGQIAAVFDAGNGGFGQAPKFPQTSLLEFLLDVHATSGDVEKRERTLAMAAKTLHEMDAGGIHDQLGGGFHRYSVDSGWRVPHFEKMLNDQAQLACVYVEAWQVTGDPAFEATARDTLDYVLRDLTDPAGGFYTAEDADSAVAASPGTHAEGAFYVWTTSEVEAVVGPKSYPLVCHALGIEPGGNVPPDISHEMPGDNIPYRAHTPAECAARFGLGLPEARSMLDTSLHLLREARAKRPRPFRDEKVLAGWNGMAISAFARASQAFGDPNYAEAAVRAAGFLRSNLFDPATGRLSRSFCIGARDAHGFAEDYAFVVQGLLDLYEATFDVRWLGWAAQFQETQNLLFWDPAGGGYFSNADGDASVLLRLKDANDGAEPSANSISIRNLVRLSVLLRRDPWRKLAADTLASFGPDLDRSPTGLPMMIAAAGWLEGTPKEILVVGGADAGDTALLVAEARRRFLPRHVLIRIDAGSRPFFAATMPEGEELPADAVAATAYVCENFACHSPASDPAALGRLLGGAAQSGR
jgi:hypothetical protein